MTRRRIRVRVAGVVFALTLAVAPTITLGADTLTREDGGYSCGIEALFILLSLEGRPADPERIASHLPRSSSLGHSMKELRDAARYFGVSLYGIRLGRSGRAPDRPAVAYVKNGSEGHFLVIRPVGHTGKLVQVIDGREPPKVLDFTDLCTSREWTGLVLIPYRPSMPAYLIVSLAGGTALTLLLSLTLARFRRYFASSTTA